MAQKERDLSRKSGKTNPEHGLCEYSPPVSFFRITVLDCAVDRVSVGIFAGQKGSWHCEWLASEALPATADANWPADALPIVRKLMAESGPRGPAVLVLPPDRVVLKHLKTPRASAAMSRQVLEFEVKQSLASAGNEWTWDALVAGEQEKEIDYLVAAAKGAVVTPLCLAMQNAGLSVEAVLPSILALRAFAPSGRLIVETGNRAATFLQIDRERIAIRSLTFTASKSGAEPAGSGDAVARLAQEAMRTILHFGRQNHFTPPERVSLVADSEWNPGLAERLAESLKVPVERLKLGTLVTIPP